MRLRTALCILALALPLTGYTAGALHIKLDKAPIDLHDKASLQRGARMFMGYCSGCHSMHYTRYSQMASDIGIVDEDGDVLTEVVENTLQFSDGSIHDPLTVAMTHDQASGWFGIVPPDLTLIARSRGVDWLYTFLRGFYADPSRPWGVNNIAFPDVGMPDVLVSLQGLQEPVYKEEDVKSYTGDEVPVREVIGVKPGTQGSMSEEQYDAAVGDLVNFLAYVGEPHQLERKRLGVWVLLFLGILAVFAYLLKKEYWKDVD